MPHIVLLGDSIFDNKAYVGGAPDVVSHLRSMVPADWQATLLAIDGSVVDGVAAQLEKTPADATHLAISAGGNDALMNADVLQMRAGSAAEVFSELAARAAMFEDRYRKMIACVAARGLPTIVATVYFPNFPDPSMQRIATAALAVFNDAIIRQAFAHGLPLVDLRLVCSERSDYANEIEPSDAGGRKIAAAVFEAVRAHDFSRRRTSVYL